MEIIKCHWARTGEKTNNHSMSHFETDVLVIGGGMAAAWAAIGAAQAGAAVTLVDKGYFGTSGVTAPAGPGHWFVPPDPELRAAAIAQRQAISFGLADVRWMERILEETWRQLPTLEGDYEFSVNDAGVKLYGAVRGPEYLRALRQLATRLGVRILDQSPALELLLHSDGSVAGARGIRRQQHETWTVRAAGVILATGGCAFFSRLLGSRTNTGDGYLMAAEAGTELSGMEFTSQYVIAPAFSTMGRGMSYAYATYYGPDLRVLDIPRQADTTRVLARHMLQGPVYCDLRRMPQDIRQRLPYISPNVMLPFARRGIDPFTDKFPVTLLAEGTIRGMGGIQIVDDDCQTSVAGLYAAGDAASRELVAGATSGGGSVNSAWALSSGYWSGRAATRRAHRVGRRSHHPAQSSATAGLQPRRSRGALDTDAIIAAARAEATDYDKNLFRSAEKLTRSLRVLDELWLEVRDHLHGEGVSAVRARETAAIVATARWSYTAALHRRESRGQHQREDAVSTSPQFERRQVVSGLDRIYSSFAGNAAA
jgi:succinate dehydrogenase/fumarate reductase flavoprotein subunit